MAEGTPKEGSKGAWSNDDFSKTVQNALALIPTEAALRYETVRASRKLAEAIKRRSLSADFKNDDEGPVVVLISENSRMIGKKLGANRAPEISDGSRRLMGRLLIAPSNLGSSYFLELPSQDIGNVFDWIEDELDLGSLPTIVFNPKSVVPEIRVYENGVTDTDSFCLYPLYFEGLDENQVRRLLDKFWETVVVAPGKPRRCQKLWVDAANFKAISGPEKKIQDELGKYLSYVLPLMNIKEEEYVKYGRYDIRITGNAGVDDFTIIHHAVLELKALTGGNKNPPYKDTDTLKKTISDGFTQAAKYREPPEQCIVAALACFDMRFDAAKRGDSCLDHVQTNAKKEKVMLWRRPLFPSAKHYRDYLPTAS